MKDYTNLNAKAEVGFDAGLRAYMLKVYNYMAIALALTGGVAFFVSQSEVAMQTIFASKGMFWIVALAPLGLVLWLSFGIHKMSTSTAQMVFWAYSVLMGLSLASIFILYTGESIARTFFITAGTFGAMSLWGYTTKKDLTGMGQFLIMGLIGIILASLVNIFLGSSQLQFVVSILGVLIFTGLTAYDTQKIKQTYYMVIGNGEAAAKAAIMGALALYLDFINLFMHLLRFVGDRR